MTCVTGDPSYASVVLLCHFDGTNGQTTFTDNSPIARSLTATLATVSTTTPKFGTGSGDFSSNTGSRIEIGGTASNFDFGSSPFTIEAWGYLTGAPNVSGIVTVFSTEFFFGPIFGPLACWYVDGSNVLQQFTSATTPTQNVWHFYTADRDVGGTLRIYIDGVVVASTTATTFHAGASTPMIGNDTTSSRNWPGRLDDVRVTKGVCRYGGAFTPPTAAFANSASATGCSFGPLLLGVGSIAFPSPGLVAALGGARAILRNKPTTRRGLLRPWQ